MEQQLARAGAEAQAQRGREAELQAQLGRAGEGRAALEQQLAGLQEELALAREPLLPSPVRRASECLPLSLCVFSLRNIASSFKLCAYHSKKIWSLKFRDLIQNISKIYGN